MFIELIDALRCTQPHEDTWLVASIARRDDRMIQSGTLGCPICAREYAVRDGVAWFGVDPATPGGIGVRGGESPQIGGGEARDATGTAADDVHDAAMLLGALLGAGEGATIAVTGTWAGAARALTGMLPMRAYVINSDQAIEDTERVGRLQSSEGIPLAPNSLQGVALDAKNVTPRDLASAIRALAPGGRLVAPAGVAIPSELAEVARDERWWVAEAQRPLVSLRRR